MSRAFVREVDDATPRPLAPRPVSAAPSRVTPRGARLIREAVESLQTLLAEASEEAAPALRRDLQYWLSRQALMQLTVPPAHPTAVGFGTRVTILRGHTQAAFTIVGEDEADPSAGLIAWTSPLAHALDGAEVGDTVEFTAGGREERIAVVAIGPA